MQDLLLTLQSVTSRLESGQLSADEVNEACEAAQQLYERWVVIRYKVFEGTPLSAEAKAKSAEALLNQTSLIDAIQEAEVSQPKLLDMFSFEMEGAPTSAEQEEQTVEEVAPAPLEQPKITEEQEVPVEAKQTPEQKEDSEEETTVEEEVEKAATEPVVNKETKKEKKSIAKAKKEEAGSLAEKLEKSPISNLKSAIGLNRKFQFINTLFDGDNERYDASIKLLNQDQSLQEAKTWVSSNVPQSFEDEDDSAVLDAFMDLVERRHS